MIAIRNKEFKVQARVGCVKGIALHSQHTSRAERIDIFESPNGAGQIGVAFEDGGTCITDVPFANLCRDWVLGEPAFSAASVIFHPNTRKGPVVLRSRP